MPRRIQMSRQRPWRADHPDAVIVSRPGKWGNPFKLGEVLRVSVGDRDNAGTLTLTDPAMAAFLFRRYVEHYKVDLTELRGLDLACWCPLDQPCHGDVLLELANMPVESEAVPALCPECRGWEAGELHRVDARCRRQRSALHEPREPESRCLRTMSS